MNEIGLMQRIHALLWLLLIANFCGTTTITASFAFSVSSQSGWISQTIRSHAQPHPITTSAGCSNGRRRPPQEAWGNTKKEKKKRPQLSSQFTLTLRLDDDLDEADIMASSPRRRNRRNVVDDGTVLDAVVDPIWKERSKRWILLVDDEVDICKAVGHFLFEQGYQVTTCTNAPTALEIIQRGGHTKCSSDRPRRRPVPHANYKDFLTNEVQVENDPVDQVALQRFRPDIVVSDVRMPEMDGIEFLTALRSDANLVGIPVVLLTAKSKTQDRITGYDAGADAYIPKPFDPEELVTIVDNVVARHEQASSDLVWTTNARGEVVAVADADAVSIEELQKDLAEIKYLLLEKGGGGVGGGFVQATNVFLAPDEQEILELLCQGLMNKEIAAKIDLSTRRVQQLLTDMFRKANVKNRTELVRWAINTGNVQI